MRRVGAPADGAVATAFGLTVLLVASLALAGLTAPAAAQADDGSLQVDVLADGDATVALTYTYDLSDPAAREAFENLSSDETATAALVDRFESRLSAVADNAATATGREMSVHDATVDLRRADDVGYVTLSVTWDGLAAVDDDRLVLSEPFASGFETDRPVTVTAPDNYAVDSATPTPDEQQATSVTWTAGQSLDGLEIVLAPSEADGEVAGDGATTGGAGPGFGAIAALVAIALVIGGLLAKRR
jgi:hypothetical protein